MNNSYPSSTMRLISSHNQYPDCLTMELAAMPIPSEETTPKQFDLYVTLNFGQQWELLLDGRVRFGLKGGTIKLQLDNAEMSSFTEDLGNYFQVNRTNSHTNPVWIIAINTNKTVCQDSFKQIKLGTVKEISQPCFLNATFSVSQLDIYLTDAEDLWRHDISPNKHAILERKLVQFLLATKFQPCLSWVQLGSNETESWQNLEEAETEKTHFQPSENLSKLIQKIYTAKTDNLLELAILADLDILTDLAGGNLLATQLSNITLSGANLCHTNLRGSNLTDADLSEANLSHAKLSGADLSGAYLGDANLTNADLHRASLALANLIGADLSGANFVEANVSNSNFSGAKVDKARFGNNPGISAEMKQILEERGAVFV